MSSEEITTYLRISDYYELLGVPRDATDEIIKKAYKKLALRFHPDKNSLEGSKEVFKKIAQACDCLVNVDKRAAYDRYGSEDGSNSSTRQSSSQKPQPFSEDFSPEAFFDLFFGKNNPFFTNDINSSSSMASTEPQQQQTRQKNNKFITLLQLLPMFLMFFGGYFTNIFRSIGEEPPMFGNEQTKHLTILKHTRYLDLTYFVSPTFEDKSLADPTYKEQIEFSIEATKFNTVKADCILNEEITGQLEMQIEEAETSEQRRYFQRKLKAIDLSMCRTLSDYRKSVNVNADTYYAQAHPHPQT